MESKLSVVVQTRVRIPEVVAHHAQRRDSKQQWNPNKGLSETTKELSHDLDRVGMASALYLGGCVDLVDYVELRVIDANAVASFVNRSPLPSGNQVLLLEASCVSSDLCNGIQATACDARRSEAYAQLRAALLHPSVCGRLGVAIDASVGTSGLCTPGHAARFNVVLSLLLANVLKAVGTVDDADLNACEKPRPLVSFFIFDIRAIGLNDESGWWIVESVMHRVRRAYLDPSGTPWQLWHRQGHSSAEPLRVGRRNAANPASFARSGCVEMFCCTLQNVLLDGNRLRIAVVTMILHSLLSVVVSPRVISAGWKAEEGAQADSLPQRRQLLLPCLGLVDLRRNCITSTEARKFLMPMIRKLEQVIVIVDPFGSSGRVPVCQRRSGIPKSNMLRQPAPLKREHSMPESSFIQAIKAQASPRASPPHHAQVMDTDPLDTMPHGLPITSAVHFSSQLCGSDPIGDGPPNYDIQLDSNNEDSYDGNTDARRSRRINATRYRSGVDEAHRSKLSDHFKALQEAQKALLSTLGDIEHRKKKSMHASLIISSGIEHRGALAKRSSSQRRGHPRGKYDFGGDDIDGFHARPRSLSLGALKHPEGDVGNTIKGGHGLEAREQIDVVAKFASARTATQAKGTATCAADVACDSSSLREPEVTSVAASFGERTARREARSNGEASLLISSFSSSPSAALTVPTATGDFSRLVSQLFSIEDSRYSRSLQRSQNSSSSLRHAMNAASDARVETTKSQFLMSAQGHRGASSTPSPSFLGTSAVVVSSSSFSYLRRTPSTSLSPLVTPRSGMAISPWSDAAQKLSTVGMMHAESGNTLRHLDDSPDPVRTPFWGPSQLAKAVTSARRHPPIQHQRPASLRKPPLPRKLCPTHRKPCTKLMRQAAVAIPPRRISNAANRRPPPCRTSCVVAGARRRHARKPLVVIKTSDTEVRAGILSQHRNVRGDLSPGQPAVSTGQTRGFAFGKIVAVEPSRPLTKPSGMLLQGTTRIEEASFLKWWTIPLIHRTLRTMRPSRLGQLLTLQD